MVGGHEGARVRVVCGGSVGHVGVVGGRSMSHVWVVDGGGVGHIRIVGGGESGVADAHIGLAYAGVGGVDGLGIGGDLSQVARSAQDVGMLAGDGGGGESRVANGVPGGHRVRRLAHGNQGTDNDKLGEKGSYIIRGILRLILGNTHSEHCDGCGTTDD